MTKRRRAPNAPDVIKRSRDVAVGIFVDGVSLDRATKRLKRKVGLPELVQGLAAGAEAECCRYYTLVPYEDDSRQRSFLDAVERAGLGVVVKRLPPKNIARQTSIEPELVTDLMTFALTGSRAFIEGKPVSAEGRSVSAEGRPGFRDTNPGASAGGPRNTAVVLVCPSRDLAYTLPILHNAGVEVTIADFGQPSARELLSGATQWIDLSTAEGIWRS